MVVAAISVTDSSSGHRQGGRTAHSWVASHRLQRSWVAGSGTKGSIYFELGESQLRFEQGSTEHAIQLDEELSGLDSMVREFRDSIREGRLPEVPGIEGLNDLALVLKAYESIEQGVSLPFGPDN